MKRRLRTIFAVLVIMVLGTSLLLWICNAILGTHQFIAAGRGRTTLELSSSAAAVSLRITSYTKPLTLQHPDATFIRTTGYG